MRITHVFETPHPQRLRDRRPRARPPGRRAVPAQRRRRGLLRAHRCPRRRRRRGRRPDAGAGPAHPGSHPHPPVVRLSRPTASRWRSSPAVRCCSAPPAAPTCSGPTTPQTLAHAQWRSARRLADRAARRDRRLPDARLRQLLLGHPVRRHREHDRPGEARQPRADHRRGPLRRRAAGRPGRLPRVLRAHGAGERRRPGRGRPVTARAGRRRRAAPAHRGRRVGRRPAQPDGVRRRPRGRHGQLRPGRPVRHLSRLADAVGRAGDAAGRDRRGRRRGPARAGPRRHRPARRHGHRQARGLGRRRAELARFPQATFTDLAAELPGPAAARRPRRPAQPGARRALRRRLGAHPDPRSARPVRGDPDRPGVGALRRRLPRRDRRRPARRPRSRGRGRRRLLRQRRPGRSSPRSPLLRRSCPHDRVHPGPPSTHPPCRSVSGTTPPRTRG